MNETKWRVRWQGGRSYNDNVRGITQRTCSCSCSCSWLICLSNCLLVSVCLSSSLSISYNVPLASCYNEQVRVIHKINPKSLNNPRRKNSSPINNPALSHSQLGEEGVTIPILSRKLHSRPKSFKIWRLYHISCQVWLLAGHHTPDALTFLWRRCSVNMWWSLASFFPTALSVT